MASDDQDDWCDVPLYDAEDEQLLAAGRQHLI
jgi:hypothetical protein